MVAAMALVWLAGASLELACRARPAHETRRHHRAQHHRARHNTGLCAARCRQGRRVVAHALTGRDALTASGAVARADRRLTALARPPSEALAPARGDAAPLVASRRTDGLIARASAVAVVASACACACAVREAHAVRRAASRAHGARAIVAIPAGEALAHARRHTAAVPRARLWTERLCARVAAPAIVALAHARRGAVAVPRAAGIDVDAGG